MKGKVIKRRNGLLYVFFFLLNACLTWVAIWISELLVSLARLSEEKGYILTDEEEFEIFIHDSVMMLFLQVFVILLIFVFFKRRQSKGLIIAGNLIAHFFVYVWFVYSVYQFTVNAY